MTVQQSTQYSTVPPLTLQSGLLISCFFLSSHVPTDISYPTRQRDIPSFALDGVCDSERALSQPPRERLFSHSSPSPTICASSTASISTASTHLALDLARLDTPCFRHNSVSTRLGLNMTWSRHAAAAAISQDTSACCQRSTRSQTGSEKSRLTRAASLVSACVRACRGSTRVWARQVRRPHLSKPVLIPSISATN